MTKTRKLNNKRRKIVSRKLNYNKKRRVSRGKGKRNRRNTRLRRKKQIYIGGTHYNRENIFKSLEHQIGLKNIIMSTLFRQNTSPESICFEEALKNIGFKQVQSIINIIIQFKKFLDNDKSEKVFESKDNKFILTLKNNWGYNKFFESNTDKINNYKNLLVIVVFILLIKNTRCNISLSIEFITDLEIRHIKVKNEGQSQYVLLLNYLMSNSDSDNFNTKLGIIKESISAFYKCINKYLEEKCKPLENNDYGKEFNDFSFHIRNIQSNTLNFKKFSESIENLNQPDNPNLKKLNEDLKRLFTNENKFLSILRYLKIIYFFESKLEYINENEKKHNLFGKNNSNSLNDIISSITDYFDSSLTSTFLFLLLDDDKKHDKLNEDIQKKVIANYSDRKKNVILGGGGENKIKLGFFCFILPKKFPSLFRIATLVGLGRGGGFGRSQRMTTGEFGKSIIEAGKILGELILAIVVGFLESL